MRLQPNMFPVRRLPIRAGSAPMLMDGGRCPARGTSAVTLIEMLVVLVIIAILAGLTLSNIRGHSESVAMDAAASQLVEDLAFARQKAISQRSTVVVVFLTDAIYDSGQVNLVLADQPNEVSEIRRLRGGVFTHYALFALRRVGEQPGHRTVGYLTEWKSLPEKTFLSTNNNNNTRVSLLPTERFPFPFSNSENEPELPYIAFDSEGRSIRLARSLSGQGSGFRDAAVSVARGAVFYARDAANNIINLELQEIPPDNGTGNVVRVDLLTGRARRDQTLLP